MRSMNNDERKRKMEIKATLENQHCGGTKEANHNDRSFNTNKADNIGDIRQDQTWVFPDGEKPQRLPLQQHALRDWEQEYYNNRYGNAVDAQRERHLKARQKKRAEECTTKRYYDSIKTGPESTVLQVDKEGRYKDRKKFVKMVNTFKGEIEEETEDARIKVLSISIHGSEESLHAHVSKVYEVKDANGNWTSNVDECMKRLGYELPDKTAKKARYNHRHETWTEQKRQAWYDIIESIDKNITIDRIPDPKNPKTKGKTNKAIHEMTKLKKLVDEIEKELEAIEKGIDRLSEKEIRKHKENLQKILAESKVKMGSIRDYIGDKPKQATTAKEKQEEPIEEPEEWEYSR